MMFDIKTYGREFAGEIVWINLDYMLFAVPIRDGNLEISMTNGSKFALYCNWRDRDDVARFKERMEGMK